MHPGPGPTSESSVVQFTAPSTATYVITGTFYAMGGGPGVTTDSVIGPGGVLLTPVIISTSPSHTFNFDETLSQGQSIDFVVGLGPGNQFNNDSTAFNADISPTPEPAFYGLLGLGLTGLAAALHRRKKAERA